MDSVSIDPTPSKEHSPASRGEYLSIRRFTEELTAGLSPEDCVVQSMPDASPAKWHLAHTTWFFETFLLKDHVSNYREFHLRFSFLFNSYYNAVGERHPRPARGLLTRPSLAEVMEYRAAVDEAMAAVWELPEWPRLRPIVEIGLHHEQQHQELLLTDIKHLFAQNPLKPVYAPDAHRGPEAVSAPMEWVPGPEGVLQIGHDTSDESFCYDNEKPRHSVYLQPFLLGSRPVTNGEFLEFIEDGGYRRPDVWLSDGWDAVQSQGWEAPLYWERTEEGWNSFTLSGFRPVSHHEPVCHISSYEADAYARWAGARLPTEAEWEAIACNMPRRGNFAESRRFHPAPSPSEATENGPFGRCRQMLGDVWEWTQSSYSAYPGYSPPAGALGEYNGKFMCNQIVLRGGSCATSQSHIRPSYRNFFKPEARWQFSGVRLARDF